LAAALVFWPRTSPELRFHDSYNLALRLLAGDRAAEARALLEPVAAAAPRNPEVVFAWGNSLLGSGDASGAMQVYRRVIALAPTHQGAWNNLGAAALEAGRVGEAREVLARAMELDRDDPKTVVLAAEAALAAGDRAGAEALVRAGWARHPANRRLREMGERLGLRGP
jgi:Flp pilus assembly protein TadD